MNLPLEGVVVLEFTHTVMGPTCGLVLADLGADVIRVEMPGGDRTRRLSGFAAGFFPCFNRNKRCICLDLKRPEGVDVARNLIARADVLIENYAPGTMERLGLGWEQAREANPRLIYCALKGFLPGPYENRPALDEIAQFMSGLAYMTGPPGQPLRAGSSVIDIMGGIMGDVAILAALRARDRDGQGRKIVSTLFESAAFLVAQHMAGEAASGRKVPPMPARESAWGVYDPFETADGGKLFIGITSDNHWRAFCDLFARPDLLSDPDFASNEQRVRNRAALREHVAAIVGSHGTATLAQNLERGGIPFSPVNTPSDLFEDPQVLAHAVQVQMPSGAKIPLPPLPISIGGATLGLRAQPPEAGEHTAAVLAGAGYSGAQIDSLREAGVIV